MHRRSFLAVIPLLLFVGVALAADDGAAFDAELARGQAIASILGETMAFAVPVLGFLWWVLRLYARARRSRRAWFAREARRAEDDAIKEHINAALETFKRNVVIPALNDITASMARTLEDHSRNAAASINVVNLAVKQLTDNVEKLAGSVEKLADRVDEKFESVNERMADLANAFVAGAAAGHYRQPPTQNLMITDERREKGGDQ